MDPDIGRLPRAQKNWQFANTPMRSANEPVFARPYADLMA
jgi:hypothetical protein